VCVCGLVHKVGMVARISTECIFTVACLLPQ
jgi:hypothetical protein